MTLNSHELFNKLMEQANINLTNHQESILKNTKVEKVTVRKQDKVWEILLSTDVILPIDLYILLDTSIQKAFSNIARIKLFIQTENSDYDGKILVDYWQLAVKKSGVNSPVCNQAFAQTRPQIIDGRVNFVIDNQMLVENFEKQCIPPVEEAYRNFGFGDHFKINVLVDQETFKQKVNQFKEDKENTDHELASKLTENIEQANKVKEEKKKKDPTKTFQFGRPIADSEPICQMIDIEEEEKRLIIQGYVFDVDIRDLKSGRKLLMVKITDYSSSILCKKFSNGPEDEAMFQALEEGTWLKLRGSIQEDTFSRDLTMMINDAIVVDHENRMDKMAVEDKRVELHAHTAMSQMDAIPSAKRLVEQAANFGHPAIAITDHGGVQSFPEAHYAGLDHGIKIIYGLEANIVDDGVEVAYNPSDDDLSNASYVVFDVETTGLSAIYDTMIELAGVKVEKGNIVEEFQEFIDPGHPLSETTVNLTGITDEMVKGSKSEKQVLNEFMEFAEGTILVAHNASFDMGFINAALKKFHYDPAPHPVIDTLELSRMLHPHFKSHRLNTLAKKYEVNLEQHHRAIYDAQTTAKLLWIFLKEAQENEEITIHSELNKNVGKNDAYKRSRPNHASLLVKSQEGLKNLFKLVSASLVDYYYRVPRIPKSLLNHYREGILLGSGCAQGEVFEAMMQKGFEEAEKIARHYDYLEIMPKETYLDLIDRELIHSYEDLEKIIKNIVDLGERLDIPVVATGNVHYLEPEDAPLRDIILESLNKNSQQNHRNPKVHFRTTEEMLEDFSFLGKDQAYQVVVSNSRRINSMIQEGISPVKSKLYTPKMEGAEDQIRTTSYDKAKELYGNPLPDLVEKRLEKELSSIIGNGFSVIYLISEKLVKKSVADGYLVGSRGSVGSSFVATMTGITEVNPLPPHYLCPSCQYSEFYEDGQVGSGFDLEEKMCPTCGEKLSADGQDIPFETFLGFTGDKVPDIDLNFSGEYQARAHNYTKELFGEDHVFRAGTIGTIADKTAFGFVKGYERDKALHYRSAEIDRLSKGLTGVKRTTGQHPGGIIVIPDDMDVYDFTPVQYPADDQNAEWKTTHFDFHSIDENVLKLDILGHDDPTMIRKLQDLSGIDPKTIPVNDKEVMKIFSGPEVLGVTEEQIFSKTGTLGVPEFGTRFVREMLEKTKPTTFSELLQISGLSHGTDVWLGNAEVLIREHGISLSEVIGCRDDIMVYLQQKGLEDSMAFKIMEFVRKGRGLKEEWKQEMRDHEVPEWYIDSCLKIKYMFPKAHAAAYILMALRVAYFKVHYPLYYYAAYFSVRASDFNLQAMVKGKDAVKAEIKEIYNKGNDATAKEKSLVVVLEIANEMLERGYSFQMPNLERSSATDFLIEGDSLLAPFIAVPSLGGNVAHSIVQARQESPFLSKEDLSKRGKVSKTVLEYMDTNRITSHLPDENQLSLFDF